MKTYLNTFLLCFLCSYSFAQLSVRNNAYVFIKDAFVYVEDDLKLEEATTRIYLRDEAQLLQGTGSTGNSGVGKLSVYQEGTVNNYAYNYWASPVGEISVNDNTNRDFIIGDVLNDATGLISSLPITLGTSYDGTASPLTISQHWLYGYSPGATYSDWDYIGAGAPLKPGYGFSMKGSTGSTSQQYDFRGKPNSGNITVDVIATQFTLAGNPYPSALDTYAFIHDTDNSSKMLGSLLFWEQDPTVNSHNLSAYVGGYATYTVADIGSGTLLGTYVPATFQTLGNDGFPASGAGTVSDPSKKVKRYLPIGQGFMIEGDPGITGTQSVTFKNSHRAFAKESGTESEFFRTSSSSSSSSTVSNVTENTFNDIQYNTEGFQVLPQSQDLRRFRLNVDFNNEITRQLVHNFVPSATTGFDYGLETNNSSPNGRDAYFIDATTMAYIAQANVYDIDLKIPLVVTIDADMPLRVRIYDVQNFNDEPIYLHDKVTDIYYDLTVLDYNTNLDTGTYTDRFEITFVGTTETLSTDEFTDSNFMVFQNNTISQLVVANPNSLTVKSVSLTDISGRQIFKKVNLSNTSRHEFSTRNLSDGVYIATVTLENNNLISKKVVIANK
ncbi:T9SS type A sorting domain-containing protein [uncultured Lacinutrix sp.]|uniref:T9SS type A sorting domain-containing protein n=1 Tax=uncultured Lacinutrix sp. TaxID=574032 RepID=UPI00262FF51D|nr:T9SS type A sorting domain-containing protein [uncultured Lacinutrix sp.]